MASATTQTSERSALSFTIRLVPPGTTPVRLWFIDGKNTLVDMPVDETLDAMIDKTIKITNSEYPIRLMWSPGRTYLDAPGGKVLMEEYSIHWDKTDVEKPKIICGGKVPEAIKAAIGGTEIPGYAQHDKAFVVSKEVFQKLKVKDVCNLDFYRNFSILICRALPKLPSE